jgi:hypothetical protein
MKPVISSIRAELEESIKHRAEDGLVPLDYGTQETQAEIEATKTLVETTQ